MTFKTTLAATATAAALVLAPMAPALAQTADAPGMTSASIPDALLESFVIAALDVSEIAQGFETQMQAAGSDEARQALANEARDAMVAAVEETDGITVEEYVAITQAAQVDQSLNARVMEMLADRAPAQ